MKSRSSVPVYLILFLLAESAAIAPGVRAKDEKLKPEEVVAKHLESIGPAETRNAVKSRKTAGTTQVVLRLGGQGVLEGQGNVFSEGRLIRVSLSFRALDYPGEHLAFDGNKVTVGQIRPGARSPLSAFMYQHDMLLKEGLMFGSLSTSWALLDVAGRQAKMEYGGLKKIDGKPLHEIKYKPKKGSGNVQVWLYFDPETFQHVRSQYRVVIPANMAATPAESAGQRDTVSTIIEQFGDHKSVDGLSIPHSYKLEFTVEGQSATLLTTWTYLVNQVSHNDPVDPKLFSVQ